MFDSKISAKNSKKLVWVLKFHEIHWNGIQNTLVLFFFMKHLQILLNFLSGQKELVALKKTLKCIKSISNLFIF